MTLKFNGKLYHESREVEYKGEIYTEYTVEGTDRHTASEDDYLLDCTAWDNPCECSLDDYFSDLRESQF